MADLQRYLESCEAEHVRLRNMLGGMKQDYDGDIRYSLDVREEEIVLDVAVMGEELSPPSPPRWDRVLAIFDEALEGLNNLALKQETLRNDGLVRNERYSVVRAPRVYRPEEDGYITLDQSVRNLSNI